jgi:hypothetical protein
MKSTESNKYWSRWYVVVLVALAIEIIIFYMLTQRFA